MENYGEYAHFGHLKIKKIEKKVKGEARIQTMMDSIPLQATHYHYINNKIGGHN